jgi:DivIVA domain-containing protein
MPLTAADVHNVAFKKRPAGERAFDADEVDAFLEGVERELARLIGENEALRARLELDQLRARLDGLRRDKAAAERTAQGLRAELERAGASGGEQRTDVVVTMARRTAEDSVADAERVASDLLSGARATARDVLAQARTKADILERDARGRHQEALARLDANRAALRAHIARLRAFERDYRAQITAHLDGLIRDLDGR